MTMYAYSWLPVVAGLLAFLALACAFAVGIWRSRTAGVRHSLAYVLRIGSIRPADASLQEPSPRSTWGEAWAWVCAHAMLPVNERVLRVHLARAGKPTRADLAAVAGRKVAYGAVGLAIGAITIPRFGAWGWACALAFMLLGYFLPDLLVYNAGLRRTQEILLTLPDALDLLDLCVESGLSLQAALARVSEGQSGPVAAEFGRVLKEMQLGVSRADAFAALGERTTQPDLQRFVAAVQQVDRLGIPVATVLREQSSQMRAKRQARAREQAQKVPVKILAPLMLCFLPGLFIIILGPAVINAVNFFLR